MTEITDKPIDTPAGDAALALSPPIQRFVLHWGDMGQSWGANRSVAQIHALLFVAPRPMNAEEIAASLSIARSNVSNSIRDLIDWGLVKKSPILGERRDHFEAVGDVWEMATKIVALRKAREIDPAKAVLQSCLDDARQDPSVAPAAVARLSEMNALIDLLDDWYAQMNRFPKSQLLPLIRLGAKAVEFLAPFVGKKKE